MPREMTVETKTPTTQVTTAPETQSVVGHALQIAHSQIGQLRTYLQEIRKQPSHPDIEGNSISVAKDFAWIAIQLEGLDEEPRAFDIQPQRDDDGELAFVVIPGAQEQFSPKTIESILKHMSDEEGTSKALEDLRNGKIVKLVPAPVSTPKESSSDIPRWAK